MTASGPAFLHMVMSKKVVYVEDALAWFNKLQQETDRDPSPDVEHMVEALTTFFEKLPKWGMEIKMGFNPLDVRPSQSGRFFAVVNSIRDGAQEDSCILTRPRELALFHGIVSELLRNDSADSGASTPARNRYIGRVMPVSAVRDPEWLKAGTARTGERTQLGPRDVDVLLDRLEKEFWLKISKVASIGDERAIWFGPRALVELPNVAQALRDRKNAGHLPPKWRATPRKSRFPLIEPAVGGSDDEEDAIVPAPSSRRTQPSPSRPSNRHATPSNGRPSRSTPRRCRRRVRDSSDDYSEEPAPSRPSKRVVYDSEEKDDETPQPPVAASPSRRVVRQRSTSRAVIHDSEDDDAVTPQPPLASPSSRIVRKRRQSKPIIKDTEDDEEELPRPRKRTRVANVHSPADGRGAFEPDSETNPRPPSTSPPQTMADGHEEALPDDHGSDSGEVVRMTMKHSSSEDD